MKKFNIRIEHDIVEYTIVEVEAENLEQALELAQSDESYQYEVDWTIDDYIGENSFTALDDDYNPIED